MIATGVPNRCSSEKPSPRKVSSSTTGATTAITKKLKAKAAAWLGCHPFGGLPEVARSAYAIPEKIAIRVTQVASFPHPDLRPDSAKRIGMEQACDPEKPVADARAGKQE